MNPEVLAFIMFGVTIVTLILGYPVALTLGGTSLLFAFIGDQFGLFNAGMLMVYLPKERILVEADAFTPGARASPFATNFLAQVRALGLRVNRIVPVHGQVVPFSALQRVVRTIARGS